MRLEIASRSSGVFSGRLRSAGVRLVHLAVDESCARRLLGDATHLPRRLYVHPCLCGRIRAQYILSIRILGFATPPCLCGDEPVPERVLPHKKRRQEHSNADRSTLNARGQGGEATTQAWPELRRTREYRPGRNGHMRQ